MNHTPNHAPQQTEQQTVQTYVPPRGLIGHLVDDGVVVMRHEDWEDIQEAIAIAKTSKRLTEAQRIRLKRMRLISMAEVEHDDER